MTPGPAIEPGTHWWKASALTTAPTLSFSCGFGLNYIGNDHSQSLLIPCQTPLSANRASPNSGVHCYAVLNEKGQDKIGVFELIRW